MSKLTQILILYPYKPVGAGLDPAQGDREGRPYVYFHTLLGHLQAGIVGCLYETEREASSRRRFSSGPCHIWDD